MILTEIDAKNFLMSKDGKCLRRLRVERDTIIENLCLLSHSTERVRSLCEELAAKPPTGYPQLLAEFSGNHQWTLCDRVEGLHLVCQRIAEVEMSYVLTNC